MTFDPLLYAAALCAASAALCAIAAIALLRRTPRGAMRLGTGALSVLLALALLAGAALCAVVTAGLSGYRALTREELAATVYTTPTGPQAFEARIVLPDGSEANYRLAGDQFAIEARILKWHPWANLLGLHTSYELDRVTGRYLRHRGRAAPLRVFCSPRAPHRPVCMARARLRRHTTRRRRVRPSTFTRGDQPRPMSARFDHGPARETGPLTHQALRLSAARFLVAALLPLPEPSGLRGISWRSSSCAARSA
jgi:hypothetical protein